MFHFIGKGFLKWFLFVYFPLLWTCTPRLAPRAQHTQFSLDSTNRHITHRAGVSSSLSLFSPLPQSEKKNMVRRHVPTPPAGSTVGIAWYLHINKFIDVNTNWTILVYAIHLLWIPLLSLQRCTANISG